MNDTPHHATTYLPYWGKIYPGNAEGVAWHPLAFHSLDAAAVAFVLLETDSAIRRTLARAAWADDESSRWAIYLVALHDIGKFYDGFQNLDHELFRCLHGRSSSASYAVRHDAAGQQFLLDTANRLVLAARREGWLNADEDPEEQADSLAPWIHATTGHHGQPARLSDFPLATYFGESGLAAANEFMIDVGHLIHGPKGPSSICHDDAIRRSAETSWALAGLTILCDWLASNPVFFPPCSEALPLAHYWDQVALPLARKAVATVGVVPPGPSGMDAAYAILPQGLRFTPLQQQCLDQVLADGPALYLMEDLPGAGKTEAALLLAHRLMRKGLGSTVFVGLPTMATANAMYRRLGNTLANLFSGPVPPLLLSHGARDSVVGDAVSKVQEDAVSISQAWLADSRKKAFLAPMGVGTIDQALLAVLPTRHQSLRLLGLGRSVLIVDEVHSYQPYVHRLLCSLLEFQATSGGSAILLSATLPSCRKAELAAAFRKGLGRVDSPGTETDTYPLLTIATAHRVVATPVGIREGMARAVPVRFLEDAEQAIDRVLAFSRAGRCVCWIRNTVTDALEAFNALATAVSPERVRLFHARFPLGDRLRIEQSILKDFGTQGTSDRRAGQILIATQVVEQSLDLDFDELITDLAPIDLLIQRCGRLHRHARPGREPPVLHVVSPTPLEQADAEWYRRMFPRGAYVYPDHGRLWLTAYLLARQGRIRFPEDLRPLIEGVYGPDADALIPPLLLEVTGRAEGEDLAERAQARIAALQASQGYSPRVTKWFDETVTPTRLADPTVVLRLVRTTPEGLEPYRADSGLGWESGDVSVRRFLVDSEALDLDATALEACRDHMPDRGKWQVIVPVCRTPEGYWCGTAARNGTPVSVKCDPLSGVSVRRKEE